MIAVAISTWQISAGGIGALLKTAAAIYSLRRMVPSMVAAVRVRRSSDNVEADIGFTSSGDLDQSALLEFTNAARPLDTVTGAGVAYSLMRIRTAYAGSAIRVRRSSDNTEQDIGFTAAGLLDTVALLAFTGAGSGFVTTWYDQSGNARNATQTTAGLQPRIVSAGAVDAINGKPALRFTNSKLTFTNTTGQPTTINVVHRWNSLQVNGHITDGSAAVPRQLIGVGTAGAAYYQMYAGNTIPTTGPAITAGASTIVTGHFSATTSSLVINGTSTAIDLGATGTNGMGTQTIGGGDGGATYAPWDGWLQEYNVFNLALTATNRTIVEQSQAVRYGITHAAALPSGFVTTWYDQTVNARNAVQPTAGTQPRIVNAGVVELENGKPTIRFLGAQWLRHTNGSAVFVSPFFAASVFRMNNSSTSYARVLSLINSATGGADWNMVGNATFTRFALNNAMEIFSGAYQRASKAVSMDVLNQSSIQIGPSTFLGVNGSITDGVSTPGINSHILTIGASELGTGALTGAVSEVIPFTSAVTINDRQLLERNEGAYYGVSVA